MITTSILDLFEKGEEMRREFCCSNCGLIWFEETNIFRTNECPECAANQGIYACDTFGYAYASEAIVKKLKQLEKSIHYAKDHPYYQSIE